MVQFPPPRSASHVNFHCRLLLTADIFNISPLAIKKFAIRLFTESFLRVYKFCTIQKITSDGKSARRLPIPSCADIMARVPASSLRLKSADFFRHRPRKRFGLRQRFRIRYDEPECPRHAAPATSADGTAEQPDLYIRSPIAVRRGAENIVAFIGGISGG